MTLLRQVLRFVPYGVVFGRVGSLFVRYFAVPGALFDLDQGDTWFCEVVIFLVKGVVVVGLAVVVLKWA